MKIHLKIITGALALLAFHVPVDAQDTLAAKRNKIALFIPLYLDDAFDSAGNDRYDFKTFPKQSLAGLEFYQGAQLALDSLQKEGIPLDVHIFDCKSAKESLSSILARPLFDSIQLIIGAVSNPEMKSIADAAALKNIPFISATYPNDGGVTGNPFLMILNSTLKTHVEAICKFIQKNYPTNPLLVFTKSGVQEERIKTYLADCNKNLGTTLKIKYVPLDDGITKESLITLLDSTKTTVCFAATMDDIYGKGLATQLASITKIYPSVLIGMPNWENWREFEKKDMKSLEIIYPTSFYSARTDKVSEKINDHYKTIQSRPTDQVFKGYETVYHFAKLLHLYGAEIVTHKSDKQFLVYTSYDMQPVYIDKAGVPDYFENKKIYFIKRYNAEVKLVP